MARKNPANPQQLVSYIPILMAIEAHQEFTAETEEFIPFEGQDGVQNEYAEIETMAKEAVQKAIRREALAIFDGKEASETLVHRAVALFKAKGQLTLYMDVETEDILDSAYAHAMEHHARDDMHDLLVSLSGLPENPFSGDAMTAGQEPSFLDRAGELIADAPPDFLKPIRLGQIEYSKTADIKLNALAGGGLHIEIETERLVLTPAAEGDLDFYYSRLYGDGEVMGKFATTLTRDRVFVRQRIDSFTARWASHNPFSAFTIRTKDGRPVGLIVAGGGSKPGRSELSYLIDKDFWGQGYGSEAADALVNNLLPVLKAHGFEVNGRSLRNLEATARPDNPGSGRILEKIGLRPIAVGHKFGAPRFLYGGSIETADPHGLPEIKVKE